MADEDRYRPAPLREVRARDEAIRRGELASAVGSASEAEARLAAARAALASAIAACDAQPTAARRVLAERFVARRRRELARLADDLARASGAVDHARAVLVRARAERELIERHFERWRAERRKLADRRED
ncbi:MAG: hypothetical protein ACM31C_07435 [Acidobacteriota bacterium]